MELTTQLEQTKKEAVSGGFGPREKKDPRKGFTVFAVAFRIFRILTEHIERKDSSDSKLQLWSICSVGNLNILLGKRRKLKIPEKKRMDSPGTGTCCASWSTHGHYARFISPTVQCNSHCFGRLTDKGTLFRPTNLHWKFKICIL